MDLTTLSNHQTLLPHILISLLIGRLAKDCGFSEDVIPRFIKEDGGQKTLGSAIIIALANYFEVSIDEMIGRVQLSKQEPQTLEMDNEQ